MKKILCIMLSICILIPLAGCKKEPKKYIYQLETGDYLQFEFDENSGYTIEFESPFKILKKDKVQTIGKFLPLAEFYYCRSLVNQDVTVESFKIDSPYKNCYCWESKEDGWNIIFTVEGTQTSILMCNMISKESAVECFKNLKITNMNGQHVEPAGSKSKEEI